jgi:hypothetical protein
LDLGPLPITFTVTTAGNGEHDYFRSSKPLLSTSGLLGPGLDCKSAGGFVVRCASGYEVTQDLPIASLPTEWEKALAINRTAKKEIAEGERHDYLRGVAYTMASQGKDIRSILTTLQQRLLFNCERGGRTIDDQELEALAVSAVRKIHRAEEMMKLIVA